MTKEYMLQSGRDLCNKNQRGIIPCYSSLSRHIVLFCFTFVPCFLKISSTVAVMDRTRFVTDRQKDGQRETEGQLWKKQYVSPGVGKTY